MSRRLPIAILLVVVVVFGFARAASATHPVILKHYRFLPRFSVLNESGGFAGVDIDYTIRGTFDFYTDHGAIDPWSAEVAKFTNVDAWASHPILAYVLPLDDVLNLSGLTGHQLPVGAPFDVYRFQGHTQHGSRVDLFTALIGPWFLMHGGTTPPEESADYFVYQIDAVARSRPFADFDDSGVIDRWDLTRWQDSYGMHSSSSGDLTWLGDADGDADIDGSDFLAWQRQTGEMNPPTDVLADFASVVQASLAATTSVPEPGVGVLFAWCLGTILLGRAPR